MAGPLEFFGDVIGGAGEFIGGVGEHLGTGLKAVRDAKRAELALPRLRQQAIEANEQFAILKGDFSPEEKENAARKIIQAIQPKLYEQRLRQDPNAKFYQPILSREEQKKKALDPYGRQYGGRGVDPYVKGAEDLGKIRKAREEFVTWDAKTDKAVPELTPEVAAYFEAAEKSVLDRMKSTQTRDNRDIFYGGKDFVGPPAPRRVGKEMETSKSAAEYFQPLKHDLRLEGQLPPSPDEGMFDRLGPGIPEIADPKDISLSDYFQAPTETVPEGNVPKTYPQMGITNVDDQATLEEMQKALPEVDMKSEYESDPELMQKLMQLWRNKKLNKSNLHKAFSMIQQKARTSLGIA